MVWMKVDLKKIIYIIIYLILNRFLVFVKYYEDVKDIVVNKIDIIFIIMEFIFW